MQKRECYWLRYLLMASRKSHRQEILLIETPTASRRKCDATIKLVPYYWNIHLMRAFNTH